MPPNITKRPQILQKDLKNENKGQIVIFGVLFEIFTVFFVFFRGKTVGEFLYFLGGFLVLVSVSVFILSL
jgi:hypothetical protein